MCGCECGAESRQFQFVNFFMFVFLLLQGFDAEKTTRTICIILANNRLN